MKNNKPSQSHFSSLIASACTRCTQVQEKFRTRARDTVYLSILCYAERRAPLSNIEALTDIDDDIMCVGGC